MKILSSSADISSDNIWLDFKGDVIVSVLNLLKPLLANFLASTIENEFKNMLPDLLANVT